MKSGASSDGHSQTFLAVATDDHRVAVRREPQTVHLRGSGVVLDQQNLDVIVHQASSSDPRHR